MISTAEQLVTAMNGYQVTQVLRVLVELQIPDHLGLSGLSLAELADETGLDELLLERLLVVAEALGLVGLERGDGGPVRVSPRPVLAELTSDGGALWGHALMSGEEYYALWAELPRVLRQGRRSAPLDLWSGMDETSTTRFARTMSWNSERVMREVEKIVGSAHTVVDVGGGEGTVLCHLVASGVASHGVLLERTAMVEQARAAHADCAGSDRLTFVGGDMFELPSEVGGADAYVLKSVLHNWSDAEGLDVLTQLREAMPAGSRLLVVERPRRSADPGSTNVRTALGDLSMLVLFGTSERTEQEYLDLLDAARLPGATQIAMESGHTCFQVVR